MFHVKILCPKLRHSSLWNPQISFYFSHWQSLISVDRSTYTFNVLRCSAGCRPSRIGVIFNRFSAIFEAFVPHFYLHCTPCIIPESLLSHPNSFFRGMFRLNTKFDADSLLYSLSHLECNGHTVHMLTQWCLLPPLTSTVKSSLFRNMCSSPSSLTVSLHQCRANCSRYIDNSWTFSRQTSYSTNYRQHSMWFTNINSLPHNKTLWDRYHC